LFQLVYDGIPNIGVWAAKFLRSGKNQCEIWAKHKNFGKILVCPEKIFVSLRKLRDVRGNFLICPAKFSYVCRKVYGMSGKIFLVCPEKIFWSTILGRNINVQFACSGKLYCAPTPPKQD
jgi:hypothetical protein